MGYENLEQRIWPGAFAVMHADNFHHPEGFLNNLPRENFPCCQGVIAGAIAGATPRWDQNWTRRSFGMLDYAPARITR